MIRLFLTNNTDVELKFFRNMLLIGAVATLGFGWLIQISSETVNENFQERIVVALLCFGIYALTFLSDWVKKQTHHFVNTLFALAFIVIMNKMVSNNYSVEYITEFVILFFARVVMGFRQQKELFLFLGLINVAFIIMLLAGGDLFFSKKYATVSMLFLSGMLGYFGMIRIEGIRHINEMEETWRLMLKNSKDKIIRVNSRFEIIYVNNMMEGLSAEQVIGKSVLNFIPPSEHFRLSELYKKVMETEEAQSYEISFEGPDGKIYWFSSIVTPFKKDGKVSGFIIFSRDNTEQHLMSEKLKHSYNVLMDFTSALETSACIAKTDLDGKIIYANNNYCKLTGYHYHEIFGKKHSMMSSGFHTKEFYEGLWRTIKDGKVWRGEVKNRAKNGEFYWHDVSIVPVTDEKGNPREFVKVSFNITSHRELEQALRRAKQKAEEMAKAKTNFLATMSHEIRTPLNAVIGMTGLLMETQLNEEQEDYAQTIKLGGETLLDVINDILDYSKIEAGGFALEEQEFHLLQAVEDTLDLLAAQASQKGIELAYVAAEAVPAYVKCDSTRLRQVLVNLVGNAIKFTDTGEVVVSIEVDNETMAGGRSKIHFKVKDTGIGIPEDKIPHLFESFYQVDSSTTRKYGGTGLGLAISKKLAEMMGGTIWVKSNQETTGTEFNFTILAEPLAFPKPVKNTQLLKGKKVLLVDDNHTNLKILFAQCRRWDMEAIPLNDPEAALKMVMDENTRFDLAILDMQMPGMDGAMLTRELRKHLSRAEMPIILLTSHGLSSDIDKSQYCALLSKPVKEQHLMKELLSVVAEKEKTEHKEISMNDYLKKSDNGFDAVKESEKQHFKILITEDNFVNQKVALRILHKLGYQADVAANGLEALNALNFIPYDLVFMDVQMPEMDGLEATRILKKKNTFQKTPVIVGMTACAMSEDRERCFEAGMDDYIAKPIQIQTLKNVLNKWFELENKKQVNF